MNKTTMTGDEFAEYMQSFGYNIEGGTPYYTGLLAVIAAMAERISKLEKELERANRNQ